MTTLTAALALEDGAVYRGTPFGAPIDAEGEIVFNTSMTGYQEIATDPSYRGQMVILTYPLIGNYGVNQPDSESVRPWLAALIVRDFTPDYSNWRAEGSLDEFLRRDGVPAIAGIDTRALVRRLRQSGTVRAVLVPQAAGLSDGDLVARARQVQPIGEKDLVEETAVRAPYLLSPEGESPNLSGPIVVVDCGIKQNILRSLQRRGVDGIVVPYSASANDVLALHPAGVVVSNGPGDPARMGDTAQMMRKLVDIGVPTFGICLGHQILGLAIGGTTSRLRYGHHGGNHPVKDRLTGKVHITSQNHEFQVDAASIPTASGFVISQVNLNDQSVEGLAHTELPIFSVQYHPEGSPGPQDSQYLFDKFLHLAAAGEQE